MVNGLRLLTSITLLCLSLAVRAQPNQPLLTLDNLIDGNRQQAKVAKVVNLGQQSQLLLELSKNQLSTFYKQKSFVTDSQKVVWQGTGKDHSFISLIQSPVGISGTVSNRLGTWMIRPLNDGNYVLEKQDDDLNEHEDDLVRSFAARAEAAIELNHNIQTAPPEGFVSENRIRILVYYDSQLMAEFPNLLDLIELDFANGNLALQNSQIDAEYIIAAMIPIDESDSANTLSDMQLRAGNFVALDKMRAKHQADLVHTYTTANNHCGQASITVFPDGRIRPSRALGVTACPGSMVFAHEIGHNLGALHNRFSEKVEDDDHNYNFGYVDLQQQFRTVMAYAGECAIQGLTCPHIPYYSNPEVTYQGQVTGIAEGELAAADNSAMLNRSINIVANFSGVGYPHNLNISKGEHENQITLEWDALPGADGYQLFRSVSGNQCLRPSEEFYAEVVEASFTDTEVPEQQYCYWVRAYMHSALDVKHYSPVSLVETGYTSQLETSITDLAPLIVTEAVARVTVPLTVLPATDVINAQVVDSDQGLNWLTVDVEAIGEQHQLVITNHTEIPAYALIAVEADGVHEYLPVMFTGFVNQPPQIEAPDEWVMAHGSEVNIPITITDEKPFGDLIIKVKEPGGTLFHVNEITFDGESVHLANSHSVFGETDLVVSVWDGEFQASKIIKVAINRGDNHTPVVPSKIDLYVEGSNALTRLLPGYDVDNDTLSHTIIREPTAGSIAIDSLRFTYTNNDTAFDGDEFVVQTTEDYSGDTWQTIVRLHPAKPAALLPKQKVFGGFFLGFLSYQGQLWFWASDPRDPVLFNQVQEAQRFDDNQWADVIESGWGLLLLKADGTLWFTGESFFDENEEDEKTFYSQPVRIGEDKDWIGFIEPTSTLKDYSLMLKNDGSLWALGDFPHRRTDLVTLTTPTQITGLYHWKIGQVGDDRVALITYDDELWTGGRILSHNFLARPGTQKWLAPVQQLSNISYIALAEKYYYEKGPDPGLSFIATDEMLYRWGKGNEFLHSQALANSTEIEPVMSRNWRALSISNSHAAVVRRDGSLFTVGDPESIWETTGSMLAQGINYNDGFAQVGNDSDWLDVWTNPFTTYALKSDGSLWSAGEKGALGYITDADDEYQLKPITALPKEITGTGDLDSDGLLDYKDPMPEFADTDLDGIGNAEDDDDDNDGFADSVDSHPLDSSLPGQPQPEIKSNSGGGSLSWYLLVLCILLIKRKNYLIGKTNTR